VVEVAVRQAAQSPETDGDWPRELIPLKRQGVEIAALVAVAIHRHGTDTIAKVEKEGVS
jgi:hypothetical protein